MNRVKELVLREFGDQGADTFEKHWAQIEYTAYWCIHLLIHSSKVLGVIPEGIDDVTVLRIDFSELHQVKCRDETQPPWTTAEVIPILCQQFHRRHAFSEPCQFHFVSDYVADTKTQLKKGTYGPLSRLKHLLEIKHAGHDYLPEEIKEFTELEKVVTNRIIELLKDKDNETIDVTTAKRLLHETWIETNSQYVRNRPVYDELAEVLENNFPGQPALTIPELQDFYDRILLLIVKKIIFGNTLGERTITRDDVLSCRSAAIAPEPGLPDLDRIPGANRAEKKARYGGFDITEFPVFANQRIRTNEKKRKLDILGLGESVTDLSLALITWQHQFRRALSKGCTQRGIGPSILEYISERIPDCIEEYFPNHEVDEVFCHGLIWQATNECHLWWHCIEGVE